MINIFHGSIFDSKSDLIVIPCGNKGGMRTSTYLDLINRKIPYGIPQMQLGQVVFRKLDNFANSNNIGYAASVDSEKQISSIEVLKSIAKQIVKYSEDNDLLQINLPLLGTGAGKIDSLISYKTLYGVFKNYQEFSFNIYCISKEHYLNIIEYHKKENEKADYMKPPRVFISYADILENRNWVKKLATELRKNKIDARLDLFHLKGGSLIPQWMTNEIIMADKVILICDQYYVAKANCQDGGVGWETMIIQGDMLIQGLNSNKYIAICREKEIKKALPIYMRSRFALNWGPDNNISEGNLRELIECIFNFDGAPPLGNTFPDYINKRLNK